MSGGLTEMNCPGCGQTIRDVDPSPDNIVRCEHCRRMFVVRRPKSSRVAAAGSTIPASEPAASEDVPFITTPTGTSRPSGFLPLPGTITPGSNPRLSPIQGTPRPSGVMPAADTVRPGSNPRLSPVQGSPRPSGVMPAAGNVRPGSNPRLSPVKGAPRPSGTSLVPVASGGSGSKPRMTPVQGNARPSSRRMKKGSSRLQPPTDEVPAVAGEGGDEELGRETRSYSKQQIIALAYDRPERVPLGPAPAPPMYKFLYASAWGIIVIVVLTAIWRIKNPSAASLLWWQSGISSPVDGVIGSTTHVIGALLHGLERVLAAVAWLYAIGCMVRVDDRSRWIAWRSAAIDDPLEVPPGSSLPLILPPLIGGAMLTIAGLLAVLKGETDVVLKLLGGGGIIVFSGLLMMLAGLCAGELRLFLWRVGQSGRSLPMRKRGDEIGLVSPVRVQAFDGSNSAILILLAVAFAAAANITMLWAGHTSLKDGAMTTRFWLLGIGASVGILGGAYALYRLASLWNELSHGWESGARSIGKPRVVFGERSSRAFRVAVITVCACIVVLVVPVVKTVAGSSVATMLLSICVPAAAALFLYWLSAVKMDSFRVVSATAAVAGPRALEAGSRPVVSILSATLVGFAAAEFLWQIYVAHLLMRGIDAGAPGQMAVYLLESVMWAGLGALPACWMAMTLLDLDRAAANLETSREVS